MFAASTRYVAAGAIMAVIVVRRGGTMRMSGRSFASCALVGLLLPGANGLLFVAEQNVPVGLASLLIAAVPLWVVVLRLGLRERRGEGALVVVEWGEEAIDALGGPPELFVSIAIAGEHERTATLTGCRAGDIV